MINLNKVTLTWLIIIGTLMLSSCSYMNTNLHIQKVAMMIDGKISDNPWNEKGFLGLLALGKEFDVSVYYKEDINTKQETIDAVKKFVNDGVNLIFGHSNIYGKYFSEIAKDYPNVHFVYFNGGYFGKNITSLNLNSQAIGFFAGMVASEMTHTKEVGIIAAYEWQPEIEGFFEGVKYQQADTKVHLDFISDWNYNNDVNKVYEMMRSKNIDVLYPAGKSFSSEIVELAKRDNIYTVGYLLENLDKAGTILMSFIQHVDKLYLYAAEQFNNESLEGGIISFGFQDEFISIGEFNPIVPKALQKEIRKHVDHFMESNMLPHQ